MALMMPQRIRFLASQGGGRKGDLSRFIEEAVRAHILELTPEQAKATHAEVMEGELSSMCAWRAAHFQLVTSRHQLEEIRFASRYPRLQAVLQPAKVGTMINNLQRALVLEHCTLDHEFSDPDDTFLLSDVSCPP